MKGECEKWRACEYIPKRSYPCDIGDRVAEILGVDSTYNPTIVVKVYEAVEWSEISLTVGGVACLLIGQFFAVRRYMRKKREKKVQKKVEEEKSLP